MKTPNLRKFVILSLTALIAILIGAVCVRAEDEGEKPMIIDVTKFGAVPNDGKNDTPAVQKAILECAKNPGATLVFPKGRYDLHADPKGPGFMFSLNGIKGLTVDGQGSEFICHGITGIFGLGGCKDIVFRNFTIDFERPPFSVGTVIAVEGNHFDVRIFDNYPVKGGEPVGAFMDYDPKTSLPAHHGLDEYNTVTSTELVSPQVLRVNLSHPATIKPGMLAVLRHQVYSYNAFSMNKCTDIRVEYVTVYTVPGMGMYAGACKNVTLERFNIIVKPNTNRMMSATADAVHFSGCTGDIKIHECTFEGMGDDAANIKSGLFLTIKTIVDDHTVLAAHNLKMSDPPDPGDKMEFTRQEDLGTYATGKVKTVEMLPNDGLHKIAFKEKLPAGLKVGDIIGNATRTAKIRVSDCTIGSNRARGMLIQNRDVVVENCLFKNCTSGGVWVLTEVVYFYESIGSRNVIIRNNTFENCGYGGPLGEGVLNVYAYLNGFKYPTVPGVHKQITLENNIIRDADNSGIFVAGADDLTIRSNTIEGVCKDPTHDECHAAIYIQGSRNVKLTGNKVDPKKQGKGFTAPLTLGPGAEKETITVKGNTGF
ncbi:MAG: right-handed parallel beta-helix repeat-containing protein [Armatimonadota bacterium]